MKSLYIKNLNLLVYFSFIIYIKNKEIGKSGCPLGMVIVGEDDMVLEEGSEDMKYSRKIILKS